MIIAMLGFLAAAGSFSISVISPVLPQAAEYLGVEMTTLTGLGVMLFQLSFGIAHLFWGWRADVQGRTPVLWLGTFFYVAGALLCLTPSFPAFITGRMVMGFGAAATLVVSRAMIRDLYDGAAFGRAMTNLTMVFALVPGVAPLVGAFAGGHLGWQGVIATAIAYGLAMAIFVRSLTRRDDVRARLPVPSPVSFVGAYRPIAASGPFWHFAGTAALGLAPLFVFYSVAATAYRTDMGVPAESAGIHVLVVTVVAYLLGGEIQKASQRFLSAQGQLTTGVLVSLAGCLGATGSTAFGMGDAWIWTLCFSIYSVGLSFTLPVGTRGAIGLFPQAAGAASAVAGMALMVAPAIGGLVYVGIKSVGGDIGGLSPLPAAMSLLAVCLVIWHQIGDRLLCCKRVAG